MEGLWTYSGVRIPTPVKILNVEAHLLLKEVEKLRESIEGNV